MVEVERSRSARCFGAVRGVGIDDEPRRVAGRGDVGVDVDVVRGGERQRRVRAPRDRIVHVHVARSRRAAAAALQDHAGCPEITCQGRPGDVSAARRHGVVLRVDQPGAGPSRGRGGRDPRVVRDVDARGRRFDEAAVAGIRCARIEPAAHIDGSRLHPAQQDDGALAILDGARLDHAGVVDHAREQRVVRAGVHDDQSAIRADQPAVLGDAVQDALVDLHAHQAVAAEGERCGAARAERHRAQARSDDAVVAHLVAEQRHVAALGCVDGAVVDDAAGTRTAEGSRVTVQAGVVEIQRGGDQPADIDLRAVSEQDAVRVDQVHLPVRVEAPEDLRAVGVEDAVDRDGGRRRLNEVDGLTGRDVEAFPVDRKGRARLLDGGGGAGSGDAARAGHDLFANRRRLDCGCRERERGCDEHAARRFAPLQRVFRCAPAVGDPAPHHTIERAHRAVTFMT